MACTSGRLSRDWSRILCSNSARNADTSGRARPGRRTTCARAARASRPAPHPGHGSPPGPAGLASEPSGRENGRCALLYVLLTYCAALLHPVPGAARRVWCREGAEMAALAVRPSSGIALNAKKGWSVTCRRAKLTFLLNTGPPLCSASTRGGPGPRARAPHRLRVVVGHVAVGLIHDLVLDHLLQHVLQRDYACAAKPRLRAGARAPRDPNSARRQAPRHRGPCCQRPIPVVRSTSALLAVLAGQQALLRALRRAGRAPAPTLQRTLPHPGAAHR